MPSFTAQQIIDRAAALADVHDNFISAQMWIDWLNAEIRALDLFRARSGWTDGLLSQTNVSLAPYEFDLALAGVAGVWEITTGGKYRRLNRIDQVSGVGMTGEQGPAYFYSIWTDAANETTVKLHPTPTSGTYTILYMPESTVISTLNDTLSYTQGAEERLVLGLAHRAMVRLQTDTRDVERLMTKWETHVSELAWAKSFSETPSVRNADFDTRGWTSQLVMPPFASWYII